MKSGLVTAAAFGLVLACCAGAFANPLAGVYGSKGNDTGGIIPWSPENERAAFEIASRNCGFFDKYPVASSIHRVPGDYIAYRCVLDPPVRHHRHHRRVDATIAK